MQQTTINHLQMPTWRWLKINGETVEAPLGERKQTKPTITDQQAATITWEVAPPIDTLTVDTKTYCDLVQGQGIETLCLTIPQNTALSSPIMLDYTMGEELTDSIYIHAQENSNAVIVLCYRGGAEGGHSGLTTLQTDKGAKITLIKAQLLDATATHVDAVSAVVEDDAHVQIILAELGAGKTTANCNVSLKGRGSTACIDSIYTGAGEKQQDMSYRLAFLGKESEGVITARGALNGKSKKVLKSTLDFITGAQKAKGREEESVLLLGNEVENLSAPLLLCGEDDVEGEHATNTGRPDQEKLFYLMSRGLNEHEAKLLLVEASFTPILDKVEPESLRAEMLQRVQEVLHSELD